MTIPRATLVCDGSSDRALRSILRWICSEHGHPDVEIEWADPAIAESGQTLRERVQWAADQYPCDVLFVHRDAEGEAYMDRVREIETAVDGVAGDTCVPVVPVRMTEAWLLFDEAAIRFAASNPGGSVALDLPEVRSLDRHPDPKRLLNEVLQKAAELPARRRRSLRPRRMMHIVAERIRDFAPLRALPAFYDLDRRIGDLMRRWDPAAGAFAMRECR